MSDHVFAGEGDGDDRLALHEISHGGEERAVGDVRVVLLEQLVCEADHLAAADAEAFVFEALDDGAVDAFGDAIGLEQDEGGFLGHVQRVGGKGAHSAVRAPCRQERVSPRGAHRRENGHSPLKSRQMIRSPDFCIRSFVCWRT